MYFFRDLVDFKATQMQYELSSCVCVVATGVMKLYEGSLVRAIKKPFPLCILSLKPTLYLKADPRSPPLYALRYSTVYDNLPMQTLSAP